VLSKKSDLKFGTIEETVAHAELIFCAVQTPHDPRYEGISDIPEERKDFSYDWLKSAVTAVVNAAKPLDRDVILSTISTVLPGTVARELQPILAGSRVRLCYNPFFIAQGTVIRDFYHPEFILLGVHDEKAAQVVEDFYKTITDAPVYRTTVENAELIKVSYNTFIGMKVAFANTIMEVCHRLPGCDVDQVTDALKMANRRLISKAYLSGGMGDGGGCHPRDNIAMSWLAREKNLSFDWFESVMMQREKQTYWLADLMAEQPNDLPRVILGYSFKPETSQTVGSPAIFLLNVLAKQGVEVNKWDPHVDSETKPDFLGKPSVFFVGTRHESLKSFEFPKGSIVLDPFRFIPEAEGVKVIGIGAANSC